MISFRKGGISSLAPRGLGEGNHSYSLGGAYTALGTLHHTLYTKLGTRSRFILHLGAFGRIWKRGTGLQTAEALF